MWRNTGRTLCDIRGRDRSDVSTSQGTSGISGNPQRLEQARDDCPREPSEGVRPRRHLNFRLLATRSVRE